MSKPSIKTNQLIELITSINRRMNFYTSMIASSIAIWISVVFAISFGFFAFQPSVYAAMDNYQQDNSNHLDLDYSLPADDLYQDQFNPPDPLKAINEPIFEANLWLDDNIISPIAKGYKTITPKPVDQSVTDFFNNLENVTTSVNLFLQGEFKASGESLARFGVNSVFGVLGLFDIASQEGMSEYKTGLNDTLKKWQIGAGTYIVLPIFGPNTPRTIIGRLGDSYTNPIQFFDQRTFLQILGFVDFRADNEDLFTLAKSAGVSPYDSIRLFFLNQQMRKETDQDFGGFDDYQDYDDYDDFENLDDFEPL